MPLAQPLQSSDSSRHTTDRPTPPTHLQAVQSTDIQIHPELFKIRKSLKITAPCHCTRMGNSNDVACIRCRTRPLVLSPVTTNYQHVPIASMYVEWRSIALGPACSPHLAMSSSPCRVKADQRTHDQRPYCWRQHASIRAGAAPPARKHAS